jgi:AcrR family transcriptional regulator
MHLSQRGDLHAEIIAVGSQLFIQQGYHGLSMRQIAEAVGVSKAALYYHFKDKEELFLAILEHSLDQIATIIDAISAGQASTRQQIQALVKNILEQPAELRAFIRLASQEMAQLSVPARRTFNRTYHERFINKIQAILQAGIERGELKPVDPSVATWALLGMMYPYFYPAHSEEVPPPRQVHTQLVQIFMDGLSR